MVCGDNFLGRCNSFVEPPWRLYSLGAREPVGLYVLEVSTPSGYVEHLVGIK